VIGLGILFLLPNVGENALITITTDRRMWLGGFTMLLAGWNVVRWRMARLRRQAEAEAQYTYAPIRPPRRDEPPNPDFDFSDPKAGAGPRDPSGNVPRA
jgi:hypothetical protein